MSDERPMRLVEVDVADPFERGPRACFSGTGGSGPEDWFLEGVEFEVDDEGLVVFTHPWLGEVVIEGQDTVTLELAERLADLSVVVDYHGSEAGSEEGSRLMLERVFEPGESRLPLTFCPTKRGSLKVQVLRTDREPMVFSFYGLTERVQSA